jgi:hypothetical protein
MLIPVGKGMAEPLAPELPAPVPASPLIDAPLCAAPDPPDPPAVAPEAPVAAPLPWPPVALCPDDPAVAPVSPAEPVAPAPLGAPAPPCGPPDPFAPEVVPEVAAVFPLLALKPLPPPPLEPPPQAEATATERAAHGSSESQRECMWTCLLALLMSGHARLVNLYFFEGVLPPGGGSRASWGMNSAPFE